MSKLQVELEPPTSRLPPIAQIATFTITQLSQSVQYLHALYRPQVRGSRRRRLETHKLSLDDEHEAVQVDAFERAYAIRWLTALIEARAPNASPTSDSDSSIAIDDTDALIQQAATLLAICAGVAAAGKVPRRFTFTSTLAGQIHVDLTDMPLDNHDYGSVGAQTWGAACVLAEMIVEHPEWFGLCWHHDGPRQLRILELGAGTGLVGLTITKLLHALPLSKDPYSTLQASVVLTDFYPAVLDNLQSNITANFPIISYDTRHTIFVTSHSLDWSSFSTTDAIPDILSTPFDVIFGADIVYEAQHAAWIRNCLESLLARPDGSNENPVFHLVIPLRPMHTSESSTVEEVFASKDHVFVGSQRQLSVLSKEHIVCEAYGDGRGDDVEYVYYRIGWTR